MPDHVLHEKVGGVLTLTLNRPEKKNALTAEMYAALGRAIDGAADDRDVRCVILQANGDSFTAGNDLSEFAAFNTGESDRRIGNPLLAALARTSTPMVAAVQGRAVGVGTTMLLHCDLVFVAEDALTQMAEESRHFPAQLTSDEARAAFAAFQHKRST